MKKYISTALFLIIGFLSCKKSGSPTPQPLGQDSVLLSLTDYVKINPSKIVEKFTYNQDLKLASIHAYTYDSSSGTPTLDSTVLSFTLGTAASPPSAYDVSYFITGNPPGGAIDHHLLFYDNQNRVIIDSITPSGLNDQSSQHYAYDNNGNITVQWLFPDANAGNSYAVTQIDTISVLAGNAVENINYYVVNGIDSNGQYGIINQSVGEQDNYAYSTFANPLYQPAFSPSLGALFLFNAGGDYLSKNLPSQWIIQPNSSNPQSTRNFTWTTNSTGKIVLGVGVNSNSGVVEEEYTFTYQ